MIELYTWGTPNGRKISVMLEECGLAYNVHKVNIGAGEQFAPDYVAINPNAKIPSIVDSDGPGGKPIEMMESGAILIYLAAKTGKFLPKDDRGKYLALQWLMFQMGHVGPMFGQVHHFVRYAKEQVPYAIERYIREKDRLYGVLDKPSGAPNIKSLFFAPEQIPGPRRGLSLNDHCAYPRLNRFVGCYQIAPPGCLGTASDEPQSSRHARRDLIRFLNWTYTNGHHETCANFRSSHSSGFIHCGRSRGSGEFRVQERRSGRKQERLRWGFPGL